MPASPPTPRRFAVLKAGTANRGARERLGDFSGMFISLLAEPGEQWDVIDVEHGQFPEDLGAYAGFAITGGRASAYDQAPWVLQLLETIREIHRRRIPLLGMCLGHQAVGLALGGSVEPNPKGWDIGARTLELTDAGRTMLHAGEQPAPRIHKLHADVVTRLPPGAVHLARSEQAEHEMFAVGGTTLCLQGHAEFDDDVIREAADRLAGAGILSAGQAETARASLAVPAATDFWRSRLRGFFAQAGLPVRLATPGLRR